MALRKCPAISKFNFSANISVFETGNSNHSGVFKPKLEEYNTTLYIGESFDSFLNTKQVRYRCV